MSAVFLLEVTQGTGKDVEQRGGDGETAFLWGEPLERRTRKLLVMGDGLYLDWEGQCRGSIC